MARDKQIATRVSKDKKTQIRVAAAKEDWDMAEFLREAADQLLDDLDETGEEGNVTTQMTAD